MNKVNVVILYSGFKKDGATATLAKYIENGIKQLTTHVKTYNVNYIQTNDVTTIMEDIKNCNVLIMGTGTYNGNIEYELLDFVNNNLKLENCSRSYWYYR